MRTIIPSRYKGHSTLEYILLFTAVLSATIAMVIGNNSLYQTRVKETYNIAAQGSFDATKQLFDSLKKTAP